MDISGTNLNLAFQSDIISLDPIKMDDLWSFNIVIQIYEGLFGYNKYHEVIPLLVDDWRISDDGLSYRFRLKKNILFHNGKELKTKDVKYSFLRILNKKEGSMNFWALEKIKGAKEYTEDKIKDVTGIKIINDYEIEIILTELFRPFLSILASPYTFIVPSNSHVDLNTYPVGTGPYTLDKWIKRKIIKLSAFKDYHEGFPSIEKIFINIGQDDIVKQFNIKKLDLLALFNGDIETKIFRTDIKKQIIYQYATWTNPMNVQKFPFSNINFRKALNYAIDKDKLIKILGTIHTKSKGYLPDGIFQRNVNIGYDFNLELAKKFLEKSKIHKNFVLNITFYNAIEKQKEIMEFYKESFTNLGLRVKFEVVSIDKLFSKIINKIFDLYIFEIVPGYSDPDALLYPYIHSKSALNIMNNNDSKLDKLIEKSRAINDRKKRNEIFQKIDNYMNENAMLIHLYYENLSILYSDRLEDITLGGLGIWFLKYKDIKLSKN
jgi:ABC-type transport system substrate-binding protein